MATAQTKRKGIGYRLKNDPIYKAQLFLTFSMVWGFINCIYNFLIGYYDDQSKLSWFYGLTIWFGVVAIIKLILLIASKRMSKGLNHANFIKIAMVYLFINVGQIALITLTPTFVGTVFASKFKGITIVNLVTNLISSIIFFSSFGYVDKNKFSIDQYSFIKSKQYIGRSEGLFTVIVLVFNIVMILISFNVIKRDSITNDIVGKIYVGIGLTFIIGNLIAGIWLAKTKKFKTHK